MQKFRFPLERLLRLRAQQERIARRELARKMTEVGEVESRLTAIEESLQACRSEIGSTTPIAGLARALEVGLLHSRGFALGELRKAEKHLEIARETYREQFRDFTALQRLREKRHAAWLAQTEKESQAELDEMARVRHAKGQGREQ